MMRTALGVSFSLVMVLGGAIACGSESTNDKGNATAGNGSVLAGGSGRAANGAGNSSGGTRTIGGATGTGGATGIPGGKCADKTITCVDATHAMGCDEQTGLVDTFSCVDELAQFYGVVSSGCTKDALNGDHCAFDDLADLACADGAAAFAYCYNATNEEFFNIYVNCFNNFKDGHTVIPCFSQYVTMDMSTAGDCANADAACFGDVVGTAGAGAGGSP